MHAGPPPDTLHVLFPLPGTPPPIFPLPDPQTVEIPRALVSPCSYTGSIMEAGSAISLLDPEARRPGRALSASLMAQTQGQHDRCPARHSRLAKAAGTNSFLAAHRPAASVPHSRHGALWVVIGR